MNCPIVTIRHCRRCTDILQYQPVRSLSVQGWSFYPRVRPRVRPPSPSSDPEPPAPESEMSPYEQASQPPPAPPPPPLDPTPPPPPPPPPYIFKSSKADRDEGFIFQAPEPTMTSAAYRWDTEAPSAEQLKYAERFFEKYPTRFLWASDEFAKMPDGAVPEVAFLGRSNVGKSSILNALMNEKGLARTSSKPGRTRKMNAFSVGDARLTLLDTPGYGHASRKSWGLEIMDYLRSRKQFRRAFLLIDPLHGVKDLDIMILESFAEMGVPYQIVLSKTDRLESQKAKKARRTGLRDIFIEIQQVMSEHGGGAGLGEILATATEPTKKGINDLRWALLVASGLTGKRK